jgi:NAD(P)-dependent dehydrogenase (short-subunit alcohol dehydrogenase family)
MSEPLPLLGRTALVTGATRGLGRAIALTLAKAGAHLILTGRTSGALEEVDDEIRGLAKADKRLPQDGATLITLNLKHGDKIDALGPTLFARFGKLDVVVGNAGVIGTLSPLGHVLTDTYNEVIEINLTSNFRLIRTLDPLLQKSDAGRAVFVTSGASRALRPFWGPYAISKAGLDALVKTYAQEVASTAVRANLYNPGPVRTRMRAKAFPGEDPMTLPTPETVADALLPLCLPACTANGAIWDYRTKAFLA